MTTKLSSTLFGVALMVGGINVASAAPMRLSNTQMDSVTAGTISISAVANANANGAIANTTAVTKTGVYSFGLGVQIGYGTASAKACCGADTTATASTSGASDSPIVIIQQSNRASSTFNSKFAFSSIVVLAINPAHISWYPR